MFGRYNRGRRGYGRQRQNMGLLLLAFQIFQFGIDRIPLITLITLLTNIGVYLHVPELFDIALPKVHDICISYQGVVVYREYSRLLLSGFYHLSDMHLYYNMASFLYKGSQLEPRLGTVRFASVIGALTVGSSAVYCALQYVAALAMGPVQLQSCAAGFSCVLFGLKVLLQSDTAPSHRLFGLPIHMAYWSELVWISFISPNVSFVGHLAGIITGLLMTKGPLNFILTGDMPRFFEGGVRSNRTWGSGVASGGGAPRQPTNTSTPRHTNDSSSNNMETDDDRELQEAIRRSLQEESSNRPSYSEPSSSEPRGYSPGRLYPEIPVQPSAPPQHDMNTSYHDPSQPHHDPSQPPFLPSYLDEIRRRRVQRFQ